MPTSSRTRRTDLWAPAIRTLFIEQEPVGKRITARIALLADRAGEIAGRDPL
jgi:hypothetical protein